VFHLIFKLYWEGVHNYRKGGYQYADLLRLIEHLSNKAALSLIDLLEKYRLEAAGYYVLRRLDTEFHFRLPPSLKEFIRVTSIAPSNEFPNEVNDLGDMWPKIWGYR